jgi:hypothetical protein
MGKGSPPQDATGRHGRHGPPNPKVEGSNPSRPIGLATPFSTLSLGDSGESSTLGIPCSGWNPRGPGAASTPSAAWRPTPAPGGAGRHPASPGREPGPGPRLRKRPGASRQRRRLRRAAIDAAGRLGGPTRPPRRPAFSGSPSRQRHQRRAGRAQTPWIRLPHRPRGSRSDVWSGSSSAGSYSSDSSAVCLSGGRWRRVARPGGGGSPARVRGGAAPHCAAGEPPVGQWPVG